MLIDKFSANILNVLGILSIVIAAISLILVIVLPIVLKTKKTNDFTQKCSSTLNNTDLWAKFPGELNTSITHTYGFFNYKIENADKFDKSYEIEIKKNISIKEEISFDNFE